MKQHFLFKHYATRLLLVSFFALSAAVQVHAQPLMATQIENFS